MPFLTLNIRVESVCKLVTRSVFGVLFLLQASLSFNHKNALPLSAGDALKSTFCQKSNVNTVRALPAFTSITAPCSFSRSSCQNNRLCQLQLCQTRKQLFSKQISRTYLNSRMPSIRRKSGLFIITSLMQQGDEMWDDRDETVEEEEDERRLVILRDVAMDRVIECFIDREIEIEGRKYATLMPADTPVILAQVI